MKWRWQTAYFFSPQSIQSPKTSWRAKGMKYTVTFPPANDQRPFLKYYTMYPMCMACIQCQRAGTDRSHIGVNRIDVCLLLWVRNVYLHGHEPPWRHIYGKCEMPGKMHAGTVDCQPFFNHFVIIHHLITWMLHIRLLCETRALMLPTNYNYLIPYSSVIQSLTVQFYVIQEVTYSWK